MNRRSFFQQLASGILVVSAPTLFLPRIVKPKWKPITQPKVGRFRRMHDVYYRDRMERYVDGVLLRIDRQPWSPQEQIQNLAIEGHNNHEQILGWMDCSFVDPTTIRVECWGSLPGIIKPTPMLTSPFNEQTIIL